MKELFKNPHTFDVNDYYSGLVYVIGGKDFERDDKVFEHGRPEVKKDLSATIKLDWSFLKKKPHHKCSGVDRSFL